MKVIFILDQIQAGFGGKERGDLPLGGKKLAIGAVDMFTNFLPAVDATVLATLYCGDDTFMADPQTVTNKLVAMCHKLAPDVVICGPAFNYEKYGMLCATVATALEAHGLPAVAAMSQECEAAISEYRNQVTIVKMPKKGGIGLTDALQKILTLAAMKVKKEDTSAFAAANCY
ncbi:GrdB-related putative oxidoreductase [Lacticaseibacillus baoqingensis]|uniref:GrdB-related putative oxidoreductase n=1 Tax=Lacticaseibacillus baoqingensis TaxID=2486013 RepID=A0ABW4E832_9LACO|nr:GrdB-related putative oxidoreductase [Lacticaseibacillus baoqingensis]